MDNDSEEEDDQKHTDATASTEGKDNHQDLIYDKGHSIKHYKLKIQILKIEVLIAEMKTEIISYKINNAHNR